MGFTRRRRAVAKTKQKRNNRRTHARELDTRTADSFHSERRFTDETEYFFIAAINNEEMRGDL